MASDESGERTETPTQRKRDESRRQGQVARSMDLSSALILAVALGGLNFFGPGIYEEMASMMRGLLDVSDAADWDPSTSGQLLGRCIMSIASMVGPLLGVIVVAAIMGNMMQVGWFVSFESITPKFSKISPMGGLKRMFSMRAVIRLVMSLGKMGLIAIICYVTIQSRLEQIISASALGVSKIVAAGGGLVFLLVLRVAILLVVLAIMDYLYQRWQHEQELKMTKQELKEDLKRMEGDPQLRARRQRVARQLAMQRMSTDVPKSTVVVTNPTHLSIAILYEEGMNAPKVLAKGADFMAMRIRQIAAASGVPMVERKPLAQALYRDCKVGDEVPEAMYKAVAEVLAYVYSMARHKKIGRHIPAGV